MHERSRGLRFLLAGGLNTVLTYLLYLALLPVAGYQLGYAIAFVSGIALNYVLGRVFVFKAHQGYRSALMLPLVYLLQYAVGAGIVRLWVGYLGQNPKLAPAISILVTLPLTYLLSKFAFMGKIR